MAKSPAEAWYMAQKHFRSCGSLLSDECTMYDLSGPPPTKVDIPRKTCESCGADLGVE
jgi:hypothetical protein